MVTMMVTAAAAPAQRPHCRQQAGPPARRRRTLSARARTARRWAPPTPQHTPPPAAWESEGCVVRLVSRPPRFLMAPAHTSNLRHACSRGHPSTRVRGVCVSSSVGADHPCMLAGLCRLRPTSGFRHQLLAFAQRRSSELSPCLRPALSAAAPRLGAHQRGLHTPAPAMGSDWSSLFSSNAAGPAGDDNKATAHAPAVSSAGATTTPSAAAAATAAASSAGAAQAAATPEVGL